MSARHALLALCAFGAAAGCSSADHARAPSLGDLATDPMRMLDGGSGSDAAHDAGEFADAAEASLPGQQGDGSSSDEWSGSVPAAWVPDAPCVAPGGLAALIAPASSHGPIFQRTGSVGARRFALGPDTLSFMTFEPDGSNASSLTLGPAVLAGGQEHLTGLVPSLGSIDLQFYDPLAMAFGENITLDATEDGALSLGVGPDNALVLWRSAGSIVGRIILNGSPGPSVDFGPGSGGTGPAVARIVYNGTDYTVAWSRTLPEALDGTSFARVGLDGKVGAARRAFVSKENHQLVDFVRLSSGYALLINVGYPTQYFAVAWMNEEGFLVPPLQRLAGSGMGWGLASTGSEFALVGSLADGRAAFRPFDGVGRALGPWVCMDDSTPGSGFVAQAGIEIDAAGYGIVVRLADGSVAYRRTDHLGTGDP
jgi:hypothetical protein